MYEPPPPPPARIFEGLKHSELLQSSLVECYCSSLTVYVILEDEFVSLIVYQLTDLFIG